MSILSNKLYLDVQDKQLPEFVKRYFIDYENGRGRNDVHIKFSWADALEDAKEEDAAYQGDNRFSVPDYFSSEWAVETGLTEKARVANWLSSNTPDLSIYETIIVKIWW